MARRFSWCTTVALVVLLFVTTEGLRERGTQVDDQKTVSRGTLRFNSRSLEESTTVPSPSRSSRDRSSQSKKPTFDRYDGTTSRSQTDTDSILSANKRANTVATETSSTEIFSRRTSSESPLSRRNGKRFSPERTKSRDEIVATGSSKVTSRRISNGRSSDATVTERLDNTGPSIFALTTESSRSRTGRKIQTTFSTRDLKTQIPESRRYNTKNTENAETTTVTSRRGRPTTERSRSSRSKVNNVGRKGQDGILYESESVRVDIPLTFDGTESPSGDLATTAGFGIVSQRRSDTKETSRSGSSRSGAERSKGRGRSGDSEAAGSSRNSSRRGSSRFNDFSTTEANEQAGVSRKSSRDRSKEGRKSATGESRSRSRGRSEIATKNGANGVSERDVKRKSTGDRNTLDRRSRLSEGPSRAVESRGQDQDSRRTRSRSRTDPTTPLATDVTTTVAPETTVFSEPTSTEPEISSTTVRAATSTSSSVSSRSTSSSRSSSTTEGSGRNRGRGRTGSQGRKQLKEDFFNHGLGFRGRKQPLEGSSSTGESRRVVTPKNDSQSHVNPGWTLRRRPPNLNYSDNLPQAIPSPRDQTNEVIPSNEVSTSTEIVTTVETSTSTMRRGSKKLQSTEESTTEIDSTTKGLRRGNKTFEKNRDVVPGKQNDHEESDNYPPEFKARLSLLKSTNTKIPAPKTTSRTPLEVKRSSASLFAERSRMKLDLARRLVKPELNIEENDLDATTASSFSKTGPAVVDETAKVAKFVKPSATGRRTSTEKRSRDDKSSNVAGTRTAEDSSRLARFNSKKGRIISERMVTSISVEERSVDDTTKPYSSTQPVVTLSSAEEGSATTIDSTRIRLSNSRKKSKEDTSSSKRRVEHDDTITTFKPKKPYVYQSRASKSQEQSTTPEEGLVTSKKTYSSSKQNGGQRKFHSSREEDSKRSKSPSTVTKPTFRPRYSKRTKPIEEKNRSKTIDDKLTDNEATITTKVPIATSRYSRKKSVVKATEGKSKTTTEGVATPTRKVEFRPRTATYRRHSEVPTTLLQSSTKVEGVAITPRSTKSQATLKTSTEVARSVAQEPQVNLKISNDTVQEAAGITGSSNGDTGNTNIFNPTRSTILTGNGTLLEQLRSTVAPLLNSLGNKTPVFSGSYSNVNVNSAPRITPNGSPPRFSARYKGAELFVRKQNNIYQPTVPSITSSSTTPATTVENSGSAPPIDVSSPGEPRYLTLYHALESANIRNELVADRVLQVDSNATVANDIAGNSNNDTTSPSVATASPQTPDTIANTTLTSRLSEDTENTTPAVTTGAPETPVTTEQVATTTEQVATTTEQLSNADQQASTTDTPSTTQQPTTNADSASSGQTSTDASTMSGGNSESSQMSTTVSSTEITTEVPTTTAPTTEANVPSTTEIASTTQGAQGSTESTTMAVSDAAIVNMSENPESNTIPFSEITSTQSTDLSSTDAPTTEGISSNMVDAETTTTIPTTTFRPRLIDFAQDILSRLQASLNATTQPSVDTTTVPPTTEISNAILDSNNTLQSMSQLNETGPATTDETTTQSAVGSVPTTTTDPSNTMVSTQEANTMDESSPVTTTTPVTPQDSQTVPNTDSTTIGDPDSSSGPMLSVDATTGSTVTTTNDTLLTELMSIAKTLLSEEMNDTESVAVQTTTDVSGESATIRATESSSISPDVTTQTLETTTMSDVTPSVDPSQNEVDSIDPANVSSSESSTDAPTTVGNIVDVELMNDTATLGTPLDENVETTTPSLTTENVQTTLSINVPSRLEIGQDITTQSPITQNTETTVATTAINLELTTNTFDLSSSDATTTTGPRVTLEQLIETTTPLTDITTVTPELAPNTSTNRPEVTTIPETTPSTVNTITSTPSAETTVEQTTVVSTMSIQSVTTDVTTASPITSTPRLDVNPMDDTGVTTDQTPLTTSQQSITDTTTNTPSETTNVPQTTPNPDNETPTVVARFQDTTSSTAQGTAGSGIGQTTEITTPPMTTMPSTIPPMQSSTPSSLASTTSSSVETTTATMTTTTQTTTKIGRVPEQLATTQSTGDGVVTVTSMPDTTVATTVPTTVTDANVEENLVSTEGTTMQPMTDGVTNATTTMMAETTTMSMQTSPATSTMPPTSGPASQAPTTTYMGRFGASRLTPAPRFSISSTTRAPLRDYLVYGIYPNKTIVRKRPEDNLIDARNVDSPYVIFGIFPDGRLVRKFPNGTIIPDPPRSPVEVVFSLSTTTTTNRPPPRPYYNQANQGVYNQYQGPVYSNIRRPEPMRNVQSPGTVDLGLTGNAIVGPNGGGPGFTGPLGTPASLPSTDEMSNALVNTQMGTTPVTPTVSTGRPPTVSQGGRIVQDRERDEATRTKEVGGQRSSVYIGQDKFVNYWTDGASTNNPSVLGVNINSVATGSNLGPSPSVPSFDNLLNNQPGGQVTAPPGFPWRDPLDQIFGITTSSPIITASVASNSLDDSSDSSNQGAARPVNPFVEIFTPLSNAIGMPRGGGTLSVTGAVPSTTTTMQPTPSSTTMAPATSPSTQAPTTPSTTTTTTPSTTTTTTTTPAPTTTTTTMAPTTTTMAPTTTTMAPTTTTMAPTTTTMAPITTTTSQRTTNTQAANIASQTTVPSTAGSTSGTLPPTTSINLPANLLTNMQQNAFGSSLNDLVFLNSLLQDNSRGSSTKSLTQVEQLLANKILSLALNGADPGPTRSPKAISFENVSPNSVYQSPSKSYDPIVIDLSPSSTVSSLTRKPIEQTSQKPVAIASTTEQVTWKPVSTTTTKRNTDTSTPSSTVVKTTLISTTKVPVTPKAVTTPRPRTTTQAPVGLAGLLWQTLLGGGLFGPSTTQRPPRPKPVKTVTKSVNITPKPIQTTQRPKTTTTARATTAFNAIDISKIRVSTPNSIGDADKRDTTPVSLLSTTKQSLLNNPNPRLPNVVTSTFSPEEETRFLLSILRAAQQDEKASGSKRPAASLDDEAFLRAILSGQPLSTTTPPPQTEISNAALLAALLKAQGIEPETPATNIREQLQLASLGQSVTSAPSLSPATGGSTTITTRPTSAATRAADTTKNTVTPRPTSRPRIRTTTWSPSSTYPPSLFSSFSNYATQGQSATSGNSDNGAIFGATRSFSQFLGAALSGAAQQLQSLVRNGTRIVSEVVG